MSERTIFLSPPYVTEKELKACFIEFSGISEGYHFDLMDGIFVSSKRMNIDVINRVRHATDLPFSVHLMAQRPHELIDQLHLAPGDTISFHAEAFPKKKDGSIEDLIELIEHKRLRPSLAVNPSTSIESVADILHCLDHILIMSVEPGKSGQTFLPETFTKLTDLETYGRAEEFDMTIAIDGGVTSLNIALLGQAGVDEVAVTTAVFKQADPRTALKYLKKLF